MLVSRQESWVIRLDLVEAEWGMIPAQHSWLPGRCVISWHTPVCAQKDESLNPGWTLPKGPSRPKAVSTAATQRGEWGPCSVCRVHRANPQGTGIPQVPLPLRSPIQRPLPSRLPSDNACSCVQEATGAGHLLLQVYRQPRHSPLPLRGHFQRDAGRRRAEGRLAA